MHARVGRLELPAAAYDQAVKILQTQAVPTMRVLDGFKGYIVLGARESGKAMLMTLWETEEALRASEGEATLLRRDSGAALEIGEIPVEHYEIVAVEVPAAAS